MSLKANCEEKECSKVVINMNCCGGNSENGGVDDTGWLDIIGTDISAGIMSIADINKTQPIRYRRKNGIVFINGVFALENLPANTYALLFTLPEGFRMSPLGGYFINTATGKLISRYCIAEDGKVFLEWIKNLSDASNVSGKVDWVGINISFPAD